MNKFAELAKRLHDDEDFEHGAGAPAAAISAAEKALGMAFPKSYRQFLGTFGWGCIGNFEIHGLGGDVPDWLNVVKMTALERGGAHSLLPPNLLPIHHEGDGDYVCIDTSNQDEGAAAMVFWDCELGPERGPKKIADDFSDWLASVL